MKIDSGSFPKPENPVMIVDDEQHITFSFSMALKSAGITDIITINNPRKVYDNLNDGNISLLFLDISMPEISGMEILEYIYNYYPAVTTVVITAHDDAETAVKAMKLGASDYLVKPIDDKRFLTTVKNFIEKENLKNELNSVKESFFSGLKYPDKFSSIITESESMHRIFKYMEILAETNQHVLITGETGTGKELFAKAIHDLSGRKGDFVPVNTAGLDSDMFIDTLFGHTRGAFTGAANKREGLVAKSKNGTIFLDEIGDLDENLQIKLLRFLQDSSYYPLGSDKQEYSSARIIAATNSDLKSKVAEKTFRADLFYRLSSHSINIPALKNRMEDIEYLVDYFVSEANGELEKRIKHVPGGIKRALKQYSFPGNVRELKALIYDSAIMSDDTLDEESIYNYLKENGVDVDLKNLSEGESFEYNGYFPTLREMEKILIDSALAKSGGKQSKAAKLLGITRQALHKKLKNI